MFQVSLRHVLMIAQACLLLFDLSWTKISDLLYFSLEFSCHIRNVTKRIIKRQMGTDDQFCYVMLLLT